MPILPWRSPEHVSALLGAAKEEAERFLASLPDRPVRAAATLEELRRALALPLPEASSDPLAAFRALVEAMDPGIVASPGPRYFGFVIGGTLPVSLAADWMVSAWDQNPGLYATSPATSVAEETAARWVLELLGLPSSSGVGFVTGCQMANFTALAAARHAVLARAGWDVEEDGLQGAPPLSIVMSEEAHVTIHTSLRYLGIGLRKRNSWGRTTRGGSTRSDLAARARIRRRACDRVRAGGQRQHRVDRRRGARSSTSRRRSAPGSTWTAPSGSGRRRVPRSAISSAGSSGPTAGRPTRTSG